MSETRKDSAIDFGISASYRPPGKVECPCCKGSGKHTDDASCSHCMGKGWVQVIGGLDD